MKTVVLIGTLDTKGVEYEFARNRFQKAGLKTILINAGIIGQLVLRYTNPIKPGVLSVGAEPVRMELRLETPNSPGGPGRPWVPQVLDSQR